MSCICLLLTMLLVSPDVPNQACKNLRNRECFMSLSTFSRMLVSKSICIHS